MTSHFVRRQMQRVSARRGGLGGRREGLAASGARRLRGAVALEQAVLNVDDKETLGTLSGYPGYPGYSAAGTVRTGRTVGSRSGKAEERRGRARVTTARTEPSALVDADGELQCPSGGAVSVGLIQEAHLTC
jgi:hypothetical protein